MFNDSIFQRGIEKNVLRRAWRALLISLNCISALSGNLSRTRRSNLGKGRKETQMDTEAMIESGNTDQLVREIIELERRYFVEKRNVKTERRRKLQAIIERHTKPGSMEDDT